MIRRLLSAWVALIAIVWLGTGQAQFNGCTAGFCNTKAPAGGGSSVTLDNAAMSTVCAASGGNFSFTIASGATALVGGILFGGGNAGTATAVSLSWNTGSMGTAIIGPIANGTTGDAYLFYQASPASGTHNLSPSFTGVAQAVVFGVSLLGSTTHGTATSATGSASVPTISVTNGSGQVAVAGFMSDTNFTTTTSTAATNSPNNACNAWAISAATSTATNPSMAYSPSGKWAAVGVSVQ